MEDAGNNCSEVVDRIVPDGCPELLVQFGAAITEMTPSGMQKVQATSLFAGQLTRPLLLKSTGPVGTIGVRFLPGGAWAFLRLPMHKLVDQRICLESIWGDEAGSLEERIRAGATDQERVHVMSQWLIQRLRPGRLAPGEDPVDRCSAAIQAAGGQIAIDQLAALAGLSHRQLERRFKTAVGLSPKLLCRIMRFHNVVAQVREGTPWSALAFRAGFFDQAHLINDFRQFAGLAPAAYLPTQTPMAQCFTQANGVPHENGAAQPAY
jgi:AraC-like DNA-binding protein